MVTKEVSKLIHKQAALNMWKKKKTTALFPGSFMADQSEWSCLLHLLLIG